MLKTSLALGSRSELRKEKKTCQPSGRSCDSGAFKAAACLRNVDVYTEWQRGKPIRSTASAASHCRSARGDSLGEFGEHVGFFMKTKIIQAFSLGFASR